MDRAVNKRATSGSVRKILISVDEGEGCERALQWTMQNLYKPGAHSHADGVEVIKKSSIRCACRANVLGFLQGARVVTNHTCWEFQGKSDDLLQRAFCRTYTI